MRRFWKYAWSTVLAGSLIILPVYLTTLLLLKAMKSLTGLIRPLARLAPDWLPAENVVSLLLVLILCFLVGIAVRTSIGQMARSHIEKSVLEKVPGYTLVRSMTRQLAGDSAEASWKAALVEIEEALVPALIIEELDDGSFTVFVPSVPTPMAGAVYILPANRVHPLDVPLTQVLKTISHWGSGSKDLVAAMERTGAPSLIGR